MTEWVQAARTHEPAPGWKRLFSVEAHTAGEPLRIVVGGFFPGDGGAGGGRGVEGDGGAGAGGDGARRGDGGADGAPRPRGDAGVAPPRPSSILDLRRHARAHLDDLRRALMWEPRGHADMYGCIVVPPVTEAADFGVLFTHNEGFSTMCGHGIIAVATAAVELGVVGGGAGEVPVGIDTPAGFVAARVSVEGGRARSVRFTNVPSFVLERDVSVDVPGVGAVRTDLVFGGAFYAVVEAAACGVGLEPADAGDLVRVGRAVKAAVAARGQPRHPAAEDPDLDFLYGTIFVGPPVDPAHHSRNVCVFADGEVDRSPTGTGVSGRLALHRARGELGVGQEIVVESILGTTFRGRVLEDTTVAGVDGVVPEVGGTAHLVGRAEWWIDPEDPLAEGFLLR